MLTAEKLAAFQSQLMIEKQELEHRLQEHGHFGLERSHPHDSVGELSSYDNHPADEGTELFERQKDWALSEHEQYELANINRALQAIEEGAYGTCIVCGQDIPIERLEALPSTVYCIEHTPDRTISRHRPVEEEVLSPPFGQFEYDGHPNESIIYDAEDAWQDVASWGTSESPSDFLNAPTDYNDMYIESDEHVGYVEAYENFVGVDIEGKNLTIYPNKQHKQYEEELDEEGIMTSFGDLPPYEREPYTKRKR
ncbi:yteA family sporulation protein [Bacillus sp. REN10]|uniref:yteA family sporulation protein n=1 Tax=Bacillus sp. REN10 TaxID=2782541 RepID=UPI00193C4956|nr:yteA family sporulation protein [Bacillus sp. REN10]